MIPPNYRFFLQMSPKLSLYCRFQKEYLIAIGVAAIIVSLLTTVIIILLAVKCRGLKKPRRPSYEDAKVHLYQNSAR